MGLVIAVVLTLSILGNLPGQIASRGHPHAVAIRVCGGLGLMIFVFWLVALAWAYVRSKQRRTLYEEEADALSRDFDEVSRQIEAIKVRLAAIPSPK